MKVNVITSCMFKSNTLFIDLRIRVFVGSTRSSSNCATSCYRHTKYDVMLLLTDGSDTVWYATSVRDMLKVGHTINTETTGTRLTGSTIPFGAHLEPSKISKLRY